MSNNIDTLIKKALRNQASEPPPHIWENIEKRLDAKQKKKRVLGWWYSSAAGIILLLSFFLLQKNKEIQFTPVAVNSVQPIGKPDTIKTKRIEIQSETTAPFESITTPSAVISVPVIRENIHPVTVIHSDEIVVAEMSTQSVEIKNNTLRKDFIPLINKIAIQNQQQYHQLLATATPKTKNESTPNKLKLSLSGSVTPGYTSGDYHSSVQNSRGANYNSKEMSGMFNIGGGLKVSVATSKRLFIQTGVFYTQMGQRTQESNIYVPKASALAIPNVMSNNRISSALGTIKCAGTNVLIYKSKGPVTVLNNKNIDGSIEQLFGAIEIPLAIKYRLNDNRIKFSIIGGISNSFIIDNRAYLVYDDKRELIGSTENIRNFNISTDLGIGIEYPITSKISFMMEPGFRYYLQSISHDAAISFRPYTFTFSTGVGINF